MNSKYLALPAIFLHLFLLVFDCAAKESGSVTPEELTKLREGLAFIRTSSVRINSYHFEAYVKIALSDEFLSRSPEISHSEYLKEYRIVSLCSKDRGKIRFDLIKDGVLKPETIYYVKDGEAIYENYGDTISATVIRSDNGAKMTAPPNVDAPLLILGFLQPYVDQYGIRAVTPTVLADKTKWETIIKALPNISHGEDGSPRLSIQRARDSIEIGFSESPNGSQYWPSRLAVRDRKNSLITEIKVIEFETASELAGMPKRLVMETYAPQSRPGESIHMATWTYNIEKMELNPVVDENEIEFDPATVDEIWDSGTKVIIPK